MSSEQPAAKAHQHAARITLLLTATVSAVVDLVAKATSESQLVDSSVDLGLLQLRLSYNPGVAFSLGNRLPSQVVVAVTAAIVLALFVFGWRRAPEARFAELVAGGAVLGGALANVIDRSGDGFVTDYLHTGWWPTFNLADTFIVVGAIVLALLNVWPGRRPVDVDATTGVRGD